MAKAKRCQFNGPSGSNLDANGWCLNDATRQTDSRAFGRPDAKLDLCQEHHEFVKAYWLAQAARLPQETP
jgi:hypothetical protein